MVQSPSLKCGTFLVTWELPWTRLVIFHVLSVQVSHPDFCGSHSFAFLYNFTTCVYTSNYNRLLDGIFISTFYMWDHIDT